MTVLALTTMHAPWVPQRRAWVLEQRRRIAPLTSVVVEDTQREGVWPTNRKATKVALSKRDATHVLVMQDDHLPCRRHSFAEQVRLVLEARSDVPVCLYSGRPGLVATVRERGGHWAVSRGFAWGGVMVLPRAVAEGFLRWNARPEVDAVFAAMGKHDMDDTRLRAYLASEGLDTWIALPSLISDVGGKQSLLGHNGARGHEVAWSIDEEERAPDWTLGLDRPVRTTPGHWPGAVKAMATLGISQ